MRALLLIIISVTTGAYLVFTLNISGSLGALSFGNKSVVGLLLFAALSCISFVVVKKLLGGKVYKFSEACGVAFVAFLCVFVLGGVAGMNMVNDVSKAENRVLTKFPKQNPFKEEFPGNFDNFVNDRVGLRTQAVAQYKRMSRYLFDNINLMRPAIVGKDHWLFYNDDYDTIKNYQNIAEYNEFQFEELKKHIMKVKEFCDAHGIKFYFMIPPNKSTIYPEFYPAFINRLNKPGYYELLTNYLKKNLGYSFIDAYENTIKEKDNYNLYYKQDTHWNSVGGYFTYEKLAESIAKDFPNFRIISQKDLKRCDAKNQSHDLINMLGGYTHDYEPSPEFCILKPIEIDYKKISNNLQPITFGHLITSHIKGPKAMIFRDSFMTAIQNYINNGISESMDIWLYGVSPLAYEKEILEYKPDIIIWEVVERKSHGIIQGNISYQR